MQSTTPVTTAADKVRPETTPSIPVTTLTPTMIGSFFKRTLVAVRLRIHDVSLLRKHVSAEDSLLSLIRKARALRQLFYGTKSIKKLARVDGKYYWTHHCPGWPSAAYDATIHHEIKRLLIHQQQPVSPYIAFVAITKNVPWPASIVLNGITSTNGKNYLWPISRPWCRNCRKVGLHKFCSAAENLCCGSMI
jgi:hypothetical protein